MAARKRHLLSYLAGLIDGEGCICITKARRRTNTTGIWSAKLVVGNTSKFIVQLFQNTFGGIIYTVQPRHQHFGRKLFYTWQINGINALPILKELLPYILIKRPQFEVAIHFLENIRKGNSGKKLTEKELALREADYILCRSLKTEL